EFVRSYSRRQMSVVMLSGPIRTEAAQSTSRGWRSTVHSPPPAIASIETTMARPSHRRLCGGGAPPGTSHVPEVPPPPTRPTPPATHAIATDLQRPRIREELDERVAVDAHRQCRRRIGPVAFVERSDRDLDIRVVRLHTHGALGGHLEHAGRHDDDVRSFGQC